MVDLQALSGATIVFVSDNGRPKGRNDAHGLDIPYLVLSRNGELTDPRERTINIRVRNVAVPPPGAEVTLQLETQHPDPDVMSPDQPIVVSTETRRIDNTDALTTTRSADFAYVFDTRSGLDGNSISTPTDYYRLRISISTLSEPDSVHSFEVEYAFLLESQWSAALPQVGEEAPGVAPRDLLVYYCDMFPFQRNKVDYASRLQRSQVPGYIANVLVPAMVDGFRLQSDAWGLLWHKEWTNYRGGDDPKLLSVALTDGQTWYHDPAPYSAHSGISINVNGGESSYYGTLTDGVVSAFHHELFHNHQRDIRQHLSGRGDIDGKDDAWSFFTEGTAVVAASVAEPNVQFARDAVRRMYMVQANAFLGGDNTGESDLNQSYARMSPYRAALYWRFLYEQCSATPGGGEDVAAGMSVIKHALEALYSGSIVDIDKSTDLVQALPAVMDKALAATPACPFHTFTDSQRRFAQKIYALRVDGHRCTEAGQPAGCGLYDPNDLYVKPSADNFTYSGGAVTFAVDQRLSPTGIASSFGMDFIELTVEPPPDGRLTTLELAGIPGSPALFDVQAWKLDGPPGAERLISEVANGRAGDGAPFRIDLAGYRAAAERLALIVVRQDAEEQKDSLGEYTLFVQSKPSVR